MNTNATFMRYFLVIKNVLNIFKNILKTFCVDRIFLDMNGKCSWVWAYFQICSCQSWPGAPGASLFPPEQVMNAGHWGSSYTCVLRSPPFLCLPGRAYRCSFCPSDLHLFSVAIFARRVGKMGWIFSHKICDFERNKAWNQGELSPYYLWIFYSSNMKL